MILEAAIINLTRNLDVLNQKDEGSISSHIELKEEALTCLQVLLESAPVSEYHRLFNVDQNELLLGYLLNVLCHIAKNDKSRPIRLQSLDVILVLIKRLKNLHESIASKGKCSISIFYSALPGVTSALFKIIMSDTKLPKNLLITAIKALTSMISVAFYACDHKVTNSDVNREDVLETCDNLGIRIDYLIKYITNQSSYIADEVKGEILTLCDTIIRGTKIDLIKRTLQSIVRYLAFSSSSKLSKNREIKLKIMLMIDHIKDQIHKSEVEAEGLDLLVIKYLSNLLDNLQEHSLTMLHGERESELSMLFGFLKLLPRDSLTTFMELSEKKKQIIDLLVKLSEFSMRQPFLFLTEAPVGEGAIEFCDERIYTVEKKFAHINEIEIELLGDICQVMSKTLDWTLTNEILRSDLCSFTNPSNLYVSHLFLKGCIDRESDARIARSSRLLLLRYIDEIQEEYLAINESMLQTDKNESQRILSVVIGIETIVTMLRLQTKFSTCKSEKIVTLKPLLCPLLNWASSESRAISEAALSSLSQISQIYETGSTKGLIEANIDYIVDGVGFMLRDFAHNPDITNVLAITFKLSAIDSFYYFKDIYEKVFRLLATYHHTDKSKSIALLFYRTLTILSEWNDAICPNSYGIPLKTQASICSVIYDIDIKRRLKKLDDDILEAENIRKQINELHASREECIEDDIAKDIETQMSNHKEAKDSSDEAKKEKSTTCVLTEKILTHCVSLISSNYNETKILALKTAACGFRLLKDDEDTLLPLVHKLWSPLVSRLTNDYRQNLEINLCAFECLVSMALYSQDFIKSRTLDTIIPRICLFLESQAAESKGMKDYGPYCMTMAYKCQLKILSQLGALAYHIQVGYSSLWRIIRVALLYLDSKQVPSLRAAARDSLHYLIALDADCVWYFAKQSDHLNDLPFGLIYEAV